MSGHLDGFSKPGLFLSDFSLSGCIFGGRYFSTLLLWKKVIFYRKNTENKKWRHVCLISLIEFAFPSNAKARIIMYECLTICEIYCNCGFIYSLCILSVSCEMVKTVSRRQCFGIKTSFLICNPGGFRQLDFLFWSYWGWS